MRPTPSLVALAMALAAALAGCSEAPSAPAEIVIESAPTAEIRSGEEALGEAPLTQTFEAAASTRGHIAGVVVDEAIRPIQGAIVRLPGMNMERPTERDGSFGFVDLYPGPYYLSVEKDGYYMAEAMLEVKSEEFTRAKVVLAAIPPPEPYHTTQKFDGFADVTDTDPSIIWGLACSECTFDLYVDRTNLRTVVFEAVTDNPNQGSGFNYDIGPYECCDIYASGASLDPWRLELKPEDMGKDDRLHVDVMPTSFPTPETNKRFQVFVTAFYNEPAPVGWSIVNGDI